MSQTITNALVLSDVPDRALAGIDLISFTTSPRFLGVKNLPNSWHFVFVGVNDSFSIRHGAWFHVEDTETDPQLLVKIWSLLNEELVPVTNDETVKEWKGRLPQIWRERLTPYRQSVTDSDEVRDGAANEVQDAAVMPLDEPSDWTKLTDCITARLLSRITRNTAKTNPGNHFGITSASSAKQDFDAIPGLVQGPDTMAAEDELQLLLIDLKQTWREGAVGRERTEAAQDRSWAFKQLVNDYCHGDENEVLGEMQMTFIMVLTLNNNSCLEQWKRILSLLLTCSAAAVEQSEFFVHVIAVLRLQLQHSLDADGGLFDLSDSHGNFLKQLLSRFRKGLVRQEGRGKADVLDELDDLEEYMKDQHGWSLNQDYVKSGILQLEDGEEVEMDINEDDADEETGEYAPLIVDLTPDQLQSISGQGQTRLTLNQKHPQSTNPGPTDDDERSDMEEESDLETMDMRY